MSELLKIMKTEDKRKQVARDKLKLIEARLAEETDSWRRAKLARMTKHDWVKEYRYWQNELAKRADDSPKSGKTSWKKSTIEEFLERTRKEWDPEIPKASKDKIKEMTRTIIEWCRTFTIVPEFDSGYFE